RWCDNGRSGFVFGEGSRFQSGDAALNVVGDRTNLARAPYFKLGDPRWNVRIGQRRRCCKVPRDLRGSRSEQPTELFDLQHVAEFATDMLRQQREGLYRVVH